MKMAKRVGVTGQGSRHRRSRHGFARLCSAARSIGGLSAPRERRPPVRLDRCQNRIDDLRTQVPSTDDLREELPAS
jgi:hypothetical protein